MNPRPINRKSNALPRRHCDDEHIAAGLAITYRLNHTVYLHQYPDADAPTQGEADVLLRALSKLSRAERLLSRCQVQQKQHCSAGQVVQQLPVSTSSRFGSLTFALKQEIIAVQLLIRKYCLGDPHYSFSPSYPTPIPSIPPHSLLFFLISRPTNPFRWSGERCKLPRRSNMVHSSF